MHIFSQNLSPILRYALNPWITWYNPISYPKKIQAVFIIFQALSAEILLFKGFTSALEI